jgi:type IV pilus assembly protein PilM
MSFLNQILRIVQDPPPSHLFELSESGIAYSQSGQTGFLPFEPGTLVVSPVQDNVLRPDVASSTIARLASPNGSKKRRPAAVILPDYAARLTILDFDSFPSATEEQLSLIKFRVKKTIPFDIDSAAVSYFVQPASAGKRIEVVAVMVAVEIIARYEALFRGGGFHPGVVTTSTLAALNLYHGKGVAVFAKLTGRALTITVISDDTIKLFRCVMLEEASVEEILSVLHPTFAYVEDELSAPVRSLVVCGISPDALTGLGCEVEPLRGRLGAPAPHSAGLMGYLEQIQN